MNSNSQGSGKQCSAGLVVHQQMGSPKSGRGQGCEESGLLHLCPILSPDLDAEYQSGKDACHCVTWTWFKFCFLPYSWVTVGQLPKPLCASVSLIIRWVTDTYGVVVKIQ